MRFLSVLLVLPLLLAACGKPPPEEDAPLVLRPAAFGDLPGWGEDDPAPALETFRKSCARLLARPAESAAGPGAGFGTVADWQPACRDLPPPGAGKAQARGFFETRFRPWKAMAGRQETGLFTGYYEASLKGARQKSDLHSYPLLRRPPDLVTVELGEFRAELKGQRIAGRVAGGALKPYEDRAAIDAGSLPSGSFLPLVWVGSPVDAFFLHIQGSGRVLLDDGTVMRVGYDGQNGHSYRAIGKELVKRGAMDMKSVTMQSIRAWLEANPGAAREVMNANPSYVFFREMEGEDGPSGAEGAVLTPGRSLAVDRGKIAYGTPVWLDADPPAEGEDRLRRLLVAQDTGGAIRGAVRGDVFWGFGDRAEKLAGAMKSRGRAWLLLPAGLDPSSSAP